MHRYLAVWLLMLLPAGAFAQQGTVKGTVLDSSRQPLEMATVGVQGRTLGVQTDAQGRYSLRCLLQKSWCLWCATLGISSRSGPCNCKQGRSWYSTLS
ncbi:carboxypeptidase-like regulatory domain-containing protein [Pontibacter sp. BAB1700]|uniref:carboxypeptidase-like regulatory domain-containing protein n=1 Tax=Pontibacter sp. BAB1700 TaxID=1144253 RepID=UPI0009DACB9B